MISYRQRKLVGLLAILGALVVAPAATAQAVPPIGASTTTGAWKFVSAPKLHPPKVRATSRIQSGKLAKGYFMLANFPNLTTTEPMSGQGGPLILDSRLQPVWFLPVNENLVATNLRAQTYQGKPVLSWWQGVVTATGASTSGQVVVVNQHYRRVAKLRATGPAGCMGLDCWVISVHDAVITGHSVWVTVYRQVPGQNLAAYDGPSNGTVYDSGVQEYDLRTGHLEYQWDALDSIPLSESEVHPAPMPAIPWDAYHINSVQPIGAHEMLVSLRNTWGIYLIDTRNGKPIWKVAGDSKKSSSFKLAPAARFQFQHDAQLQGTRLTVFDDACCAFAGKSFAPPLGPSRGLELALDFTRHTAALVHQYRHTPTLDAAFLGSMQVLQNGNALVGWGSTPYFSEYSRTGKLLLDAVFPGGGKDLSYRALLENWVGIPYYTPSAALVRRRGHATVYASWDGATQVASWELLAGRDARHLKRVTTRRRSGFETAIPVPAGAFKVFRVRALDRRGHVLRSSGMFPTHHRAASLPQSY